jgi:glutathione synthase/RimK-type ligase-like ATP-grasp enzyme
VKSVATAFWEHDGHSKFVFARGMTATELPEPAALALAPMAFQQRIEPKRDVRVTVVGENVYAARLEPPAAELDWRLAPPGQWFCHELPAQVAACALSLVAALGLRFAGIDLIQRGDEYVFIELNPNGEWGWLEDSGLPIAAGLATELLNA